MEGLTLENTISKFMHYVPVDQRRKTLRNIDTLVQGSGMIVQSLKFVNHISHSTLNFCCFRHYVARILLSMR